MYLVISIWLLVALAISLVSGAVIHYGMGENDEA
jgi:hypothetical protein